jgi:hypothetical protein
LKKLKKQHENFVLPHIAPRLTMPACPAPAQSLCVNKPVCPNGRGQRGVTVREPKKSEAPQ